MDPRGSDKAASHVRDPPFCPADRPADQRLGRAAPRKAIAASTEIVSVLALMAILLDSPSTVDRGRTVPEATSTPSQE